jgi:cytochrome c-type biogenesis protein CcmH/NrfG
MIANYRLFGDSPAGWHGFNIVLHSGVCILLLLFLTALGTNRTVAAVIAALFAVHPVHVESVTWISGMPDPLMSLFVVGGLYAYVRFRAKLTVIRWIGISLLLFLGLASKEVAIAMVPIVLVIEYVLGRQEGSPRKKALGRAALHAIPLVFTVVAYFLVRASVLGSGAPATFHEARLSNVVLTAPAAIVFYLKQSLWPFGLSPTHSLRMVSMENMALSNFWTPLLIVVAILVGLVWLCRRNRFHWIAVSLFVFPLIPAFDIRLFPPEDIVRDRYLYLPIAGLIMLIVGSLVRFRETEPAVKPQLKPLVTVLPFIAGLATMTFLYSSVWLNGVSLWERGVAANPNGSFAWVHLTDSYRRAGRAGAALRAAQSAIETNPEEARAYLALGLASSEVADFQQAEMAFRRILDHPEVGGQAAGQLARILASRGKVDEAVAVLRQAIEVEPGQASTHLVNIAVIYGTNGNMEAALSALKEARPKIDRASPESAVRGIALLGDVYLQLEKPAEAKLAYQQYLDLTAGASGAAAQLRETVAEKLRLL